MRAKTALAGLLLLTPFMLTALRSAVADGINLYWNDCGGGISATTNKTFACDSNTTDHFLVASYVCTSYIETFGEIDGTIDIQSAGSSLPPWWSLARSGGCRSTALTAMSTSSFGTCYDPWGGWPVGPGAYYLTAANTPAIALNRARMNFGSSTDHAYIIPLDYLEATAAVLRIRSMQTVGASACDGCTVPVCLVLNSITLRCFWDDCPPIMLTSPLTSNYVTWQGGAIGGPGCPGATPTINRTWGQLKSIYR